MDAPLMNQPTPQEPAPPAPAPAAAGDAADATPLALSRAVQELQRIEGLHGRQSWRLTVRIANPGGLSAHQTVDVTALYAGFDWEKGRVVLETAQPLTVLSREQLEELRQSARKGLSWHAYRRERVREERVRALEAEVRRLGEELAAARAPGGSAADRPRSK